MSATLTKFSRWLMPWLRKRPQDQASGLPWGLTAQEIQALRVLESTPSWPHFLRVLERVAEVQASELASGLSHDRYLFACGALSAYRRAYTLVPDLIETATRLENATNARQRSAARAVLDAPSPFVNSAWWDAASPDARREH